jgi:hypothetical protein
LQFSSDLEKLSYEKIEKQAENMAMIEGIPFDDRYIGWRLPYPPKLYFELFWYLQLATTRGYKPHKGFSDKLAGLLDCCQSNPKAWIMENADLFLAPPGGQAEFRFSKLPGDIPLNGRTLPNYFGQPNHELAHHPDWYHDFGLVDDNNRAEALGTWSNLSRNRLAYLSYIKFRRNDQLPRAAALATLLTAHRLGLLAYDQLSNDEFLNYHLTRTNHELARPIEYKRLNVETWSDERKRKIEKHHQAITRNVGNWIASAIKNLLCLRYGTFPYTDECIQKISKELGVDFENGYKRLAEYDLELERKSR